MGTPGKNAVVALGFACVACVVSGIATAATFNHAAIPYFVPDKRVRIDAGVSDPKGVQLARVYFKTAAQADYLFVPMAASAGRYSAVLPAPNASSTSLEYLILALNNEGQVTRTDAYTVSARRTADTPVWQSAGGGDTMKVFTEIPSAPKTVAGFTDSIALDVVESGARLGAAGGLYGAPGAGSASAAAGGGAAVGGGAAAGAGAGAAAGGAAVGGLSTAAIVGGVVVAGGLAAAAAGGGGGGGGSSSPPPSLVGNWSGTETGTVVVSCPAGATFTGSCPFSIPFSGPVNASNVFTGTFGVGQVTCSNPALTPIITPGTISGSGPLTLALNANGTAALPPQTMSGPGTSLNCGVGSVTFNASPRAITGSQLCSGSFSGCSFVYTINFSGS